MANNTDDFSKKEDKYKSSKERLSRLSEQFDSAEFKRIYEEEINSHTQKKETSNNQNSFSNDSSLNGKEGQPVSPPPFHTSSGNASSDVSPPKKKNKRLIITLVVIGIIIVGARIVLIYNLFTPNTSSTSSEQNTTEKDNSPLITGSSKMIKDTNIPVYFETKKRITENRFSEMFDKQPAELLDNCQVVYICDATGDNTCVNEVKSEAGEDFSNSSGWTFSEGQKIFLNASNFDSQNTFDIDTVTYFLGVQYDYANGIAEDANWQQLYQQYGSEIKKYAEDDNYDFDSFFGITCAWYFNHLSELKKDTPELYNAMQDLFGYYS